MATRVEESYTERDQKVNAKGKVTEIEIPYIVFEAVNEDAALSAARTKAATALRGNQMEQRMFMATQEIEKHTKKAAELLKDMGGGGTQTFQ